MIACGALVRELRELGVQASYLPAPLHSRPIKIPDAVEQAVRGILIEAEQTGTVVERIVLGYGDCGTGGLLDVRMQQLQDEFNIPVERLPGDHCYSFFLGESAFQRLHEEELGTFFLTDFLARHFDQLVWGPLKIGEHPELRDMYFGNYKRVVYISQTSDPEQLAELTSMAEEAADRLELDFEQRDGGLDPFDKALRSSLKPTPIIASMSPSSATSPNPTPVSLSRTKHASRDDSPVNTYLPPVRTESE